MITNFDEYHIKHINENIQLTDDEKNFLWGKIEHRKKKRAEESENEIYNILKGDKKDIDDEDFNKILNSLEYTFRKKISGDSEPMKSPIFKSIIDKIPSAWIGVKYSSIKARDKKLDKKPTLTSSKKEIFLYLDKNNIEYDSSMVKKDLINLLKK